MATKAEQKKRLANLWGKFTDMYGIYSGGGDENEVKAQWVNFLGDYSEDVLSNLFSVTVKYNTSNAFPNLSFLLKMLEERLGDPRKEKEIIRDPDFNPHDKLMQWVNTDFYGEFFKIAYTEKGLPFIGAPQVINLILKEVSRCANGVEWETMEQKKNHLIKYAISEYEKELAAGGEMG